MSFLSEDHMKWHCAQAKFTEGLSDIEISKQTGIPRSTLGDFFRRQSHKLFWEEWDLANKSDDPKGPKVALFDIETSPIQAYIWGLFNQNVQLDRIVKDWYMLCFAYKWLGENEVKAHALCDYQDYVSGSDCEQLVVEELWNVLNECDIVIAHNAIKFDVKKTNAKFLEYGLGIPSPYKVVDTLQIVKENFAATSNKLDYYTKLLSGDGKMEHEGFGLWRGCMEGSKDHWGRMIAYNIQDITELENVYLGVRGWSKKHPNVSNYYEDSDERCNVCGSRDLSPNGEAHAGISVFEAVTCNECGHNQRKRVNLKSKEKMKNTMVNV